MKTGSQESVTRKPMVGWYDPGQLMKTGVEVAISTIFGRHSDHRLMEALAAEPADVYDYSNLGNGTDPFWLDYVGDVGDGFNSTYAVAYALAQPRLPVREPDGTVHDTSRGAILVFGGDQVYPTASRLEYKQRLVGPYRAALESTEPPHHPLVFAIPGNHDWYDSLVSFTRLFLSKQWFGGWRAPQSRSYFALRLPYGWWLLGTDVQLASDIDAPQVKYFQKAAEQMREGDRVILCNAEPHWIYSKIYGMDDANIDESNLAFLEGRILRDENAPSQTRVSVFMAGDLHHYRRHEHDKFRFQKITSGGGGAFLHPTHGPDVSSLPDPMERDGARQPWQLKGCFPDTATSKRLCRRNLLFPTLNPKFGILTAVLYALTAWSVMADIGGETSFASALGVTASAVISKPSNVFWILATVLGFRLFTDTHSRQYRMIAGTLHGLAHLLGTFFLGWGAAFFTVKILGMQFKDPLQLLLAGTIVFAGGWLIGSFIMGAYLWISLNWFGRHQNEAFSSLAIPDFKNFIRLRIDPNGDLQIYPVGIRRVPREWTERLEKGAPRILPADPRATEPELIERPITVPRNT